jgi:hypothetical protein
MRKSKGYAKGGAKMMKARGGKMAKGYAKGGAKMMKAMGGKMASKGGRKMMKAMGGKMAKGYAKGGKIGMTLSALKAGAKKMGYSLVKQPKTKTITSVRGIKKLPNKRTMKK